MRILYNAAAAFALNSSRINQAGITKSLERLSTGLRINRASDDAAGLSISEGMRANIKGTQQAIRNVQDGLSLLKIEEDVLNEINSKLQRIRELAIKAGNDSLTDNDRLYVHQEAAALLDEIDRSASVAPYLGGFQMDGSYAPYKRTTNTANETIANLNSVIVSNPDIAEEFFGKLLTVEILENAAAQELDDISTRSKHIQDTILGTAVQDIESHTIALGQYGTGIKGNSVLSLTAGVDPVDTIVSLTRGHDGGAVTNALTLNPDPVAGDANFNLTVGGPVDTNGMLYVLTNQAGTTNPAGYAAIADTDMETVDKVQVRMLTDRELNGDGVLTLTDAGSLQSVYAKNWSDFYETDLASGSFALSRGDATDIDMVETKNLSKIFTNHIGSAGAGEDINADAAAAPDSILAKTYSIQKVDDVFDFNGVDGPALGGTPNLLVERKEWSEGLTSSPGGLIDLTAPGATNIVSVNQIDVFDAGGWKNNITLFDNTQAVGVYVYEVDAVNDRYKIGISNGVGLGYTTVNNAAARAFYTLDDWAEVPAVGGVPDDGDMGYTLVGDTLTVGYKNSGGITAVSDETRVNYETDGWNTIQSVAAGDVGDTVYEWIGNKLTVGRKMDGLGLVTTTGAFDVFATYDTSTWQDANAWDAFGVAEGDTVYKWDNATGLQVGQLQADMTTVTAAGGTTQYNSWISYSTSNWIQLQENTVAVPIGQTSYDLVGNTLTVGKKNSVANLESTGATDYDLVGVYNTIGWQTISSAGASATGEMAYTFTPGDRGITIGVDSGAGVSGVDVGNILVDYKGWEDDFTMDYKSNNVYVVPGAGASMAAGNIQFAQDLYNGAVGADNLGSTRMEVRINGGNPITDFTYYDDYGGLKNVIKFYGTSPLAGDTVTVDYATPSGDPVIWGAATIGETTMANGSVSADESRLQDGVFNDYWNGQAANTITISQANRGRFMTLTLDPTWTVNQLIDQFNAQAEIDDVEALAYWDAGAAEVRLRPGTSGWKDRSITGWDGPYFELSGQPITTGTNLGGGSVSDTPTSQNVYRLNETTTATNSRIRVTLEDGTELADSTSTWNQHEIAGIGLTINVLADAQVGDTSDFYVSAFRLQAGPNNNDPDLAYFSIPDVSTDALGVDTVNLTTRTSAFRSIGDVDDAINTIIKRRMYFGSKMNQLEHVINNLTNSAINTTASESAIRDTDIAVETSKFAKSQILLKSTMAVLGQANLAHKNVLQLISAMKQ